MNEPQVTRMALCSLQVCVPKTFTDAQVEEFANTEHPTGISSQWQMRHTGDASLNGAPERAQCDFPGREDCCHIMLDC